MNLFEPFFKAGTKLSDVNINYYCEGLNRSFKNSGNPIYPWLALNVCIKARKPIPSWVTEYLFQCSERMFEAQDTSDLQAVLPRIFGFPKKRPGPGKPLNPHPSSDKTTFADKFLSYILEGKDPKTARTDACNDTLSCEFADNVESKTLDRYLLEALGLEEMPDDAQEWETITVMYAAHYKAGCTLLDANATEADREKARAILKESD
jgi:hypothetical protein